MYEALPNYPIAVIETTFTDCPPTVREQTLDFAEFTEVVDSLRLGQAARDPEETARYARELTELQAQYPQYSDLLAAREAAAMTVRTLVRT